MPKDRVQALTIQPTTPMIIRHCSPLINCRNWTTWTRLAHGTPTVTTLPLCSSNGDFGPTGEYRGLPSSTATETSQSMAVSTRLVLTGSYINSPPDRLFESYTLTPRPKLHGILSPFPHRIINDKGQLSAQITDVYWRR